MFISKYKIELVKESSGRYVEYKTSDPEAVFKAIEAIFNLSNQTEEVVVLLALDTKNKIIGALEVSRGSVNASLVHPREVFKRLLLLNSTSFIVAHNHPSGSTDPSPDDITLTNRLTECGQLMGIALLDHLIVGDNDYLSMKAGNYIK